MDVPPPDERRPVRVVIVDDVADIRTLLRVHLQLDGRFEVVGEGADGDEAIALARDLQPDLVVLDRNMPRLGGLEAIGPLREAAPDTAVVLYTAQADGATYHAALAAGALDVFTKVAGHEFVERFTAKLLDQAGRGDRELEVRVGPVSATAAQVWIANSKKILAAVAENRDVVNVPDETIELLGALLDEWEEIALDAGDFIWVARADREEVTRIVEQWAIIDGMSDDQLTRLGVAWSPPAGQPFFEALTAGVLHALARLEGTQRLAARLVEQWAPYREGGSS